MYIKLRRNEKLEKIKRKSGRADKILDFFDKNKGELFTVRQVFQWFYDAGDKMSESTIYRLVNILCDDNQLQRKRMPGGICFFERTEGKKHDHIICTKCNFTFPLYEKRIESLFARLAGEHNATIEDRDVVIYVSCVGDLCPREA